jgi:hypothetical protein
MSRPHNKALAAHRSRLKRKGIIRLEVRVRRADAPLVRGVAEALSDPARENEARALLREHFGRAAAAGLKALLASTPLKDVPLERARDSGRTVEL